MKVIEKPIEMIASFDVKGNPTPIRFRLETEDESYQVIKIDKVIDRSLVKCYGDHMIVFHCQSIIGSLEKRYEVRYELNTCKWLLYKM